MQPNLINKSIKEFLVQLESGPKYVRQLTEAGICPYTVSRYSSYLLSEGLIQERRVKTKRAWRREFSLTAKGRIILDYLKRIDEISSSEG